MANNDQSLESPNIRYNLIRNRMEFFRAGVQWTPVPIVPAQIQPLEEGHLLLGDMTNTGMPVELSGDGTLADDGVLSVSGTHLPITHLDDSQDIATPGFYWIDTGSEDDVHVGLPDASGVSGTTFTVNAVQANFMDVHATGGQTIDGSVTPVDIHNQTRSFISDGSNWHTI